MIEHPAVKITMGASFKPMHVCLMCKQPITKEKLVTFNDGQWYDGDWHKGCLTTELAMMRASRAMRQLGRDMVTMLSWPLNKVSREMAQALILVTLIGLSVAAIRAEQWFTVGASGLLMLQLRSRWRKNRLKG